MQRRKLLVAASLALALAASTAACAGPAAPSTAATGSVAAGRAASGAEVTVFAAASMQATFTQLGTIFESTHPGVTVSFNFAGSQALADQIVQGAPADVFASANEANMATVTTAGLASSAAQLYATNTLTIAVPPDNPAKVASFTDLATPGLKLVVCAPAVPCGAAAVKLEQLTGVTLAPVSEEQAVADVLAKVRSGEADAGLVYATDVLAAGDAVLGVAFPESSQVINRNSIVALTAGPQAALGQQFVDLVLSPQGRTVLAAAGFGSVG